MVVSWNLMDDLPSGERLQFAMERSTSFIMGKKNTSGI